MTPFLSWAKLDVCFEFVNDGTLEVELSEELAHIVSELIVVGRSEGGQLGWAAVGHGTSDSSW